MGVWTTLVVRWCRRTNHARLGDWKRLLLGLLHVAVEKVIVDRVIDLGGALEMAEAYPIAIGQLRIRDDAGKVRRERLNAGLGDLIITFVALRDPVKLIGNRSAQLNHLGAQVDDCEMVRTVALRKNPFAGSEVEVLVAKTNDHAALKRVYRTGSGDVLIYNFIDSLKASLCLGRGGTRDNQLRVQLSDLLVTEQSRVRVRTAAPAKVDDLVFFLVIEHGVIRRRHLGAQFLDAILQPTVGTPRALVLGVELVCDVGVGNGISHLGG